MGDVEKLQTKPMSNIVKYVKLVVFVPETHAEVVRQAMGKTGAGVIGNYSFCSFSVKGIGKFKPMKGAKPAIGTVGELESVREQRIEITCERNKLDKAIRAIKKVHPYEEIVIDVYPLEDLKK